MKRALLLTAAIASSAALAVTSLAGEATGPAGHPAVAREMAGVWLPDGRRSGRVPRELPFTEDAKAAAKRYDATYGPVDPTVDDSNVSCLPDPFPYPVRLIAQYPFEIVFTPKRVTMFHEIYGYVRRIYLDERDAPAPDTLATVMGRSIGHWEGDTLVIETTRVRKDGTGRFSGSPPVGNARHFQERISIGKDPDGKKELRDELTITDAAVLAQPVKVTMLYKWSPDIEVGEYLCQQDIWDQNQQGSPSSVPWRK